MSRPIPPCRGCGSRKEGCHANCEGYQEYRKAHEDWRAMKREENKRCYEMDNYYRHNKKWGGRHD